MCPGDPVWAYRTVVIDPLVVSTDKDWRPVRQVETGALVQRHPASSAEIQFIEDTIEPTFRRIFVEELAAGGCPIVDHARGDTLRVSAGLAFVYIDTPASGMGRLRNDDTMMLVMNLSNASTGQLLARMVGEKSGKLGMLESPNTVANNMKFRCAVRDWAGTLRDALGTVAGAPGQQGGGLERGSAAEGFGLENAAALGNPPHRRLPG